MNLYSGPFYVTTLILLFVGLFLLLIGYLLKDKKSSHIFLIFGWISFGLFWLTQIPHFLSIGDTFNAMFCFLGFILFLYFAYHESLNYKWNDYLTPLNYIAGIAAIGGLFYYLFERVEILTKAIIYAVAWKTVLVLNVFGFEAGLGDFGIDPHTHDLGLGISGTGIGIILACTGIQSIAIFVGILLVTKPNRDLWISWDKKFLEKDIPKEFLDSRLRNWLWNRKQKRIKKVIDMSDRSRIFRSFMYTIPVIYILNIIRNVLIIWGTHYEILGENTFHIAHDWLSKFLSLGVLIIMVFLIFELLPECRENILGLLDLKHRIKPGLVKDGFVDLDKVDKLEEKIEKRRLEKNRNSLESSDNKKIKNEPK